MARIRGASLSQMASLARLVGGLLLVCAIPGVSQTPPPPAPAAAPAVIVLGDSKRAQATRTELEAQLVEIDKVVASPGYSSRLRAAKRAEAQLIRERLAEGDIQVGDQVNLSVSGDSALSNRTFSVSAGRVLVIPGMADIALKGVLRSEVQAYLTERLKTYIKDPQVRAQTLIRHSIFGAVGKPGFYQVPAELLAGDAIMTAGGPQGNAEPGKTVVKRAGVEILGREAFADALVQGRTLDQLNLRAGDEINVGAVGRRSILPYFQIIGPTTALIYLFVRIFR